MIRKTTIFLVVLLMIAVAAHAVAPFVLLGSTALRFTASAGIRWVVNKWRAEMTQSFVKSALVHATAGTALFLTYDNVVNSPPAGERYINVDLSGIKAPVKARADAKGYSAAVSAVTGSSQATAAGWCNNVAGAADLISSNPSRWQNNSSCGVVYDYYNNDYVCMPVGKSTTRGNFTTKRAQDVYIGGQRADIACAASFVNEGKNTAAENAAAAIMADNEALRETMRELIDAINGLNGTLSDTAAADAENRRNIDGEDAEVVGDDPGDGEVDPELTAGGNGASKADIEDAVKNALGQPAASGDASVTAASGHSNNVYDTAFTEIPKDNITTKIQGWIGNNPLKSLIQGSSIQISSGACSMPFDAFGQTANLSFCDLESELGLIGSIVLGIATLYAFFIAFGVRGG